MLDILRERVTHHLDLATTKEEKEVLSNVYNNGADWGVPKFTYYTDTCEFSKNYMNEIYEHLKFVAHELGECPFEMVTKFNCLKDSKPLVHEVADVIHGKPDKATINDGMETVILNALAWFTLEEVAREYDYNTAE